MNRLITVDRATLAHIVAALENSIDDVRTCLADAELLAGYPRYDRRIAAYKEQVAAHKAAITAGRTTLSGAEPAGLQSAQPVAAVPWIEALPDDATHVSIGKAHNK